ncbi:hypothetical protein P7C73_g5150, partial [Tremellales sp. Uapishka_1]
MQHDFSATNRQLALRAQWFRGQDAQPDRESAPQAPRTEIEGFLRPISPRPRRSSGGYDQVEKTLSTFLQDEEEHAKTKQVVEEFLNNGEGAKWQKKLEGYAEGVDSYIEEFWYDSYLSHSDSVVLSLNPFFVLSSDVNTHESPQLPRASSLIFGSLSFIHDLRNNLLTPDDVRGVALDMSQYSRLFASCRVPTDVSGVFRYERLQQITHASEARMQDGAPIPTNTSDWFNCLDSKDRPLLSDREILSNLEAIVKDADKTPVLQTINPSTPSLFKSTLSPFSKSSKKRPDPSEQDEEVLTTPKKLEWRLTPDLRAGIRYAETRISDLICQNDSQALEFRGYGSTFMKRHGFSPDAFVQMAFQAAYYGLYGRVESTYEPAMTKAFVHGRTEAIRTVQPDSVDFVKTFCSDGASNQEKVTALRKACKRHTNLTRECSQGMGQDRHLYAMYCLIQREIMAANGSANGGSDKTNINVPAIFTDPGYNLLGTSILSTSNCGNPALRLFGFGPVCPEGYGIGQYTFLLPYKDHAENLNPTPGYIIKEEGISVCMSSKHLQTRRLLHTLQAYLLEIQKILIGLWKEANERPEDFMDHQGVLRDARTGKAISVDVEKEEDPDEEMLGGFGFFDIGSQEMVPQSRRRRGYTVGKQLTMAEY